MIDKEAESWLSYLWILCLAFADQDCLPTFLLPSYKAIEAEGRSLLFSLLSQAEGLQHEVRVIIGIQKNHKSVSRMNISAWREMAFWRSWCHVK